MPAFHICLNSNILYHFLLLFIRRCVHADSAPSSEAFQEVEDESEERRNARLKQHLKTQERMVIFLITIPLTEYGATLSSLLAITFLLLDEHVLAYSHNLQ